MLLDLYATRTIPIPALAVQPGTFGNIHTMKLAQGTLTIQLPDAPHHLTSLECLVDDPDHPDHTWKGVENVTLCANLDGQFSFNGTDGDFNSNKIFRSADLSRSFQLAESLLDDGFDLWKRTLRWTAVAPNIGIDELETPHSVTRGHGFKMFRKDDGALVRSHGGKATMHGLGKVSREAWKSAADALTAQQAPPVWFDFLHEAFRLMTVGNNRSAIVSAAIAAETVLRGSFRANLPIIDDQIASRILDEVPAQKLLGKWEDIVGVSKNEAKRHGRSAVHELFDLRNTLMHEGLRDQDRLSQIVKLLPKVTSFTLVADEYLTNITGLPRRIFPAPGVIERMTS